MGIGWSSLILAVLLALEGGTADSAFEQLAAARGVPVPDTAEQRAWVGTAIERLRVEPQSGEK